MTRYARWVYAGWLVLTSLAIVVQFYLAGYGVFAFNGLGGFDAHIGFGSVVGILILVSLVLAFVARVPWRLTAINGALLVLMALQYVLAHTGVPAMSALHVINGVLIFAGALYLTWEGLRIALNRAPGSPTSPPASAQTPAASNPAR